MTEADELDELEPAVGDHRGKDVIELYELPALFCKEGTDNAPTTRPIVWAYVWKKQGASLGFINWHPIEEMADLDQLRDVYGAGIYQVQGRGSNRKDTVKQVTVTIGAGEGTMSHAPAPARAELDIVKLGGAIVAVATPILGLLKEMWDRSDEKRRAERQEDERRRSEERARDDARQQAFMQTMTGLMTARNSDLEAMVKAKQSGTVNGTAEAFADGQASTLEMLRVIKEEGLGGEDAESKIISLVGSFMQGKQQADKDVEAAQANGGKS